MTPASNSPSVAFYIGGYEAIGGIEACFDDIAQRLSGSAIDRAMFVWGADLPQLAAIERSGTTVYRTTLKSGCRFGLPDRLLYRWHGAKLARFNKIVFGKFPPLDLFRSLIESLDRRPGSRPETLYITAYRPAEMWRGGLPDVIRVGIDTMVVQSSVFADDLRKMGFTGRILEIPYLPPRAAEAATTSPGAVCRLGFLGRFVHQKNLFYLLDIVAQLQDVPVELHLFGDGAQKDAVMHASQTRGLPVLFHGAVPREGVSAAIDSCDIFLNPSISEGQCLVALEVLSRGRPFLASAVGAIPQILGNGHFGEILPLNDAPAAAEVVRRVIAAWREGGWSPSAIVEDYRRTYDPDAILRAYTDLFTSPSPDTHALEQL